MYDNLCHIQKAVENWKTASAWDFAPSGIQTLLPVRPANDQTQYWLSYVIHQLQCLGIWPVLFSKESLLSSRVLISYIFTDIVNGKCHSRTCFDDTEGEYRFNPTLSLTSAVVDDQCHSPAVLSPGKTVQEAGKTKGRSARVRKISLPPGFDPRILKAMANSYTDWATPANNWHCTSTYGDCLSFTPASITYFRIL